MELIIHLSDIHFSKETKNIEQETNLISNCICSHFSGKSIDGIIIVISGDMANWGLPEEFSQCTLFIKNLKYRISKRMNVESNKTCFISCPGNHDIYYEKKFMREDYVKMTLDEKCRFYKDSLKNYYNSQLNPVDRKDWLVCNRKFTYKNFGINFSFINTTIGSIYDDSDIDKGIHSLPKEVFDDLKTDPNDINFMVMHHSKEYFYDEEWEMFDDIMPQYYNVVLFGHEHKNRDNHIENEGRIVEQLCGGELLGEKSIFNLITIEENKKLSFYKAIRQNGIYEISVSGPEYRVIKNNNIQEIYDNDFIDELNEYSLVDDAKLNDIYVFPTMTFVDEFHQDSKIEKFEDFEKLILDDDINTIVIDGDDLSGKSLLAKSLFMSLMENYHPLLVTPYDFQTGSIENCFKRIVCREYNNSKINHNSYFQFEDSKVVIFDDFDKLDVEKSNKIKKVLYDKFDKIIYLKNLNNANFLKSIIDGFVETKKIVKLNISPMLYIKRGQLVYNICVVYYKNSKTEQEIQRIANVINETINKQLNILNLNPQFVVLCVNSLLKNDIQLGSSNGFTAVFHSNITRQLERIKSFNKDDIDEYLYILQNIAYKAHISKEYPISIECITQVINNYNLEGGVTRPKVSVLDFVKNLESCKMIQKSKSDSNKFIFISSNYFSYFVAKNIVSLVSDSKMDNEVIDKLIKEMCFGVNGDILLYLAYILQSKRIIDTVYTKADEFFKGFDTEIILNPKECNVEYLHLKKTKLLLDVPNKKDKKNNLKRREQDEEKIVKKKKEMIDYNYEEKDLDNTFIKIRQAIKYIELLSRLLPDFMHLNPERTKDIVIGLYSYSNKLLYYVLKPYEEFFEKDSKILAELYNDGDIPDEFRDENKFKQAIQQISHGFVLNVYNLVARLSSSKKTLYAFDNLCDKGLASNEILNLMVHENVEKLEDFANKFLEIDSKYNDILIENYLKQIIRHHCVKNSIVYSGINQKVINKYLVTNPDKKKVSQLRLGKK